MSQRNNHRYTLKYSFSVLKIGTLVVWPTVDLSAKRCTLPINATIFCDIWSISTKFDQFGSIWLVVRNVRIQRRVLWYFAGTPRPSISTTLPRSNLIGYVFQKEIVRDNRFFGLWWSFEHFLIKKTIINVEIRENENIQIPFWTHVNVLFRTCYRMYVFIRKV